MTNTTQKKIVSSLMWKFFEQSGVQFITFFLSLLLARLLTPDDYGVLALLTIYTSLAQVFITAGFINALLQKKDADDLDYSSVFYTTLTVSIVIYILFFAIAPFIADYYAIPEFKNLLRFFSLTIIITTYQNIQVVILSKSLMFKKQFFNSLCSVMFGGFVGIFFALNGFGTWALVAQQLSALLLNTILLSFNIQWRPKLIFSFERLRILFSFGWKILCSGFLDTVYKNIYSIIIGARYSTSDLAFWNKGNQLPLFLVTIVDNTVIAVIYPVMAKVQDNKKELKKLAQRSISMSAYIMFPICMGLAICAEEIVLLLLSDKWLPCVPFLRAWCFVEAWKPLQTANAQMFKALGRSDIFLKLEVIKKLIGITILLIALPLGLEAMAFGIMIAAMLSALANAMPNHYLMNYSYLEQFKDVFPALLLSTAMGSIVWLISFLNFTFLVGLLIQIISGILVYIILSFIFKIETFHYLLKVLKLVKS